jgi:transcription antitermination factor NusG
MVKYDASPEYWYALEVKPVLADSLATVLCSKGFEVFHPTYLTQRIWCDRTGEVRVPLFRGYLFSRFDLQKRMPVVTTPGVKRVLGIGKQPIPVPDEEISRIRAVVASRLPMQPCAYLAAGTNVMVERGPLAGTRGVLLRYGRRCRVVVSVELIQRSVAVEIDENWIRPIEVGHAAVAGGACGVAGF